MATESVKIVDPDNGPGAHYTSLSAWNAGEQRDLTASDEIAVAKCRTTGGTADTTAATISGFTVDATRYIKVWTDPAESYRHAGVWDTSKYRIVASSSSDYAGAIRSQIQYSQFIGLQLEYGGTGGTARGGFFAATTDQHIEGCIVRNTGTPTGFGIHAYYFSGDIIVNNIVYDFPTGIGTNHNTFTTCVMYNNTVCDASSYNFYHSGIDAGTLYAKNNLFQGAGTCWSIGYNFGTLDSATNITEDATSPDGASYRSIAVTFVNEAGNDFHLDSSEDGNHEGTDLSADVQYAFSTDIDGDTRSDWDIGADEITAATQIFTDFVLSPFPIIICRE